MVFVSSSKSGSSKKIYDMKTCFNSSSVIFSFDLYKVQISIKNVQKNADWTKHMYAITRKVSN